MEDTSEFKRFFNWMEQLGPSIANKLVADGELIKVKGSALWFKAKSAEEATQFVAFRDVFINLKIGIFEDIFNNFNELYKLLIIIKEHGPSKFSLEFNAGKLSFKRII
jgi:hypothetical protein